MRRMSEELKNYKINHKSQQKEIERLFDELTKLETENKKMKTWLQELYHGFASLPIERHNRFYKYYEENLKQHEPRGKDE